MFKSSQVNQVDVTLACSARSCEFESCQDALMEIGCAFPLDKELTDNCVIETCKKLEELIPTVMFKYGLTRVQLLLCLQQSLINVISWNGMSWAIVVSKHLLSLLRPHGISKSEGIVHLKSMFCFS